MAGMGPPPLPPGRGNRRRRQVVVTALPAAGRSGRRTPKWPLPADIQLEMRRQMAVERREASQLELEDCTDGRSRGRIERQIAAAIIEAAECAAKLALTADLEKAMWRELWRTPQAAVWESMGSATAREVATYVRFKVRGELGDMDSAKEARQWSDRLGLNPQAMLRLRWEMERTAEAEARGARRRNSAPAPRQVDPARDPRTVLRSVPPPG